MAGNHKAGGKITRSHTTIIDLALPIISFIEKQPDVSKIGLGIIKSLKVGDPRLKYLPITGGFKLIIRGRVSIQEFYVYTKEVKSLQDTISKKYSGIFR